MPMIRYLRDDVTIQDLLEDSNVINYAQSETQYEHERVEEIFERYADQSHDSLMTYEVEDQRSKDAGIYILVQVQYDSFDWEKYFKVSKFDKTLALGDEPEILRNIDDYVMLKKYRTFTDCLEEMSKDEYFINYSWSTSRERYEEALEIFMREIEKYGSAFAKILNVEYENDWFILLFVRNAFKTENYLDRLLSSV